MENLRKRKTSRVTAILLALMMVVVFVPTFAFATDGDAAEGITVFMTVSDKGTIAKTKDNEPMAWKEVNVKDLDNSGDYTFDEALVAAHEAYNDPSGYDPGTGFAKTIWGKEAFFLFFNNDEGLPNGITVDTVKNGDYLTAAILSDTTYWTDWYSAFDVKSKETAKGASVELTLKGHLGMAYTEETKKDVPLPNVTVKDVKGNTLGQTDDTGKIDIPFEETGTYIITASGVKKDEIVSVRGIPMGKTDDDKYYVGEYVGEYDMNYFYTEEDYGDGPYPADEIKKIDMYEWMDMDEDEQAGYNLVYADNYVDQTEAYYSVLVDAPLIAPACIVNVGRAEPADVTMTMSNEGVLAKAKDGSAMIEKPVTVKDTNCDGKLSYDEALVATHDAYFEGGAKAGYASAPNWVTKFWGVDGAACYEATNGVSIPNGVSSDTVKDGDVLTAGILSDTTNWSDRVTEFDKTSVTVEVQKKFSVQLSGKGMYAGEAEPFENVKIGTWENGAFKQISNLTTDADGKATVSFAKAGTYILTASGTVNRDVSVWDSSVSDYVVKNLDCPIFAPYCIVKVTPHVHKLAAVKAKLATAKKAGNTAYWKCAGCGKFFSNAKGTKVIKKNSWVVKKSAMTAKAKTVKAKAKKKTVITKAKAFTVKKAPGKVTFKKLSGNKKITVSKAGKVTVKKGLKKGKTYTVKVKVTSAKTAKYAAISKTVKLKVKITK